VVQSQASGASFHKLRLECSALARAARPGQFVHVLPHKSGFAPIYDPLLRRAFSIMSTSWVCSPPPTPSQEAQGDWFEILFRVGGKGTSLLAQSRVGDTLDVLGPLGNGFSWERVWSADAPQRPLFLVGGGIGVPPLVFTTQTIDSDKRIISRETNAPTVEVFVGARTAGELVEQESLERSGARIHIATDDGSQGHKGVVTQILQQRLAELQSVTRQQSGADAAREWQNSGPLVCACGPWPMLKAVAKVCMEMEVECQVSLEENMPCGVGVCNGCVVPVLDAADDYGRFQRICVHGPVLNARSVDWGDATISSVGPAVVADTSSTPEENQRGASQ
jgi:dihydroorotate dehydrogenase electron transfer subunit